MYSSPFGSTIITYLLQIIKHGTKISRPVGGSVLSSSQLTTAIGWWVLVGHFSGETEGEIHLC